MDSPQFVGDFSLRTLLLLSNGSDNESGSGSGSGNGSGGNGSNGSGSSGEAISYFDEFQKYYDVLLRSLLLLGIVGNVVNLFVLTRPALRGVTFVYLFWLAISDLCFLLISFFVHVVDIIDSELRYYNYHVMFGLCRISFAGSNLFCGSSAFLVTVLTIDRHRAVLTPFKCKRNLSRRRAFVRISLSFLLAFVINVPLAFQTNVEHFTDELTSSAGDAAAAANGTLFRHHREVFHCSASSITENGLFRAYVVLREGVSKAATVLIVTVLNIRIIIALQKQGSERKQLTCSAQRSRSAEERKLVQLLLAIVVVFVVCTTPQMILWVTLSKDFLVSNTWLVVDGVGELLLILNAAANFYIYCFSSAAVRRTLIAVLQSCRRSSHAADVNSPWTTSASVSNDISAHAKRSL